MRKIDYTELQNIATSNINILYKLLKATYSKYIDSSKSNEERIKNEQKMYVITAAIKLNLDIVTNIPTEPKTDDIYYFQLTDNLINFINVSNCKIYFDIPYKEIFFQKDILDIKNIVEKNYNILKSETQSKNIHLINLIPHEVNIISRPGGLPLLPSPSLTVNLFDENERYIDELVQNGIQNFKEGKVGIVLLAGGGGTRLINSLNTLLDKISEIRRKYNNSCVSDTEILNDENWNTIEPDYKWAAQIILKSNIFSNLKKNMSKLLVPMTAIQNKSTIEENLESLSAISRDYFNDLPIVIIVGPSTKDGIIELLKNKNFFGFKNIAIKEQDTIPFINEETCSIEKITSNEFLKGSNGGGGALISLFSNNILNSNGDFLYEGSALEWFKQLGITELIVAQTDDAKDKYTYLGLAGLMNMKKKQSINSIIALGYNYPPLYNIKTDSHNNEIVDFSFKIGSIWNWIDPNSGNLWTKSIEYNELSEYQKKLMRDAFDKKIDSIVIGNGGSYCLDIKTVEYIVSKNLLPLHPQFGKKENIDDGTIINVTKMEYFLPDIIEIASYLGLETNYLMLRDTSKLEGKLNNVTVDSLPVKDIVKLAIAQISKIYKDKKFINSLGIYTSENSTVEIGNLAIFNKIGTNIRIIDNAKIYFGGNEKTPYTISIGNNVVFKDDVTVKISGNCNVEIEDNVCFEGKGCIIIDSKNNSKIVIHKGLNFNPFKDEIMYLS